MWWKRAIGIVLALGAYACYVVAGRADRAMDRIAALIHEPDDIDVIQEPQEPVVETCEPGCVGKG